MTVSTTNVRLAGGNGASGTADSIRGEFGTPDPVPVFFSEYARGGAYVPIGQGNAGYGIPAQTAPFYMGRFRNQTKNFIFNDVITSAMGSVSSPFMNYNLLSRATAAGYPGGIPLIATITVQAGAYVSSTSTGSSAMVIPSLVAGSSVAITNSGVIVGRGGVGSAGGSSVNGSLTTGSGGAAGGLAMTIGYNTLINNGDQLSGGIIGGGGGGGGGGGANSVADKTSAYAGMGGGGGGGGIGIGSGGAGGPATSNANGNYPGAAGAASSGSLRGAGGAGGSNGSTAGGAGGAGGNYGQQGFPGGAGSTAGGAGGSPGSAISGGGFITWNSHGRILGTVDSFGIWTAGGSDFTGQMSGRVTLARDTALNGAWTSALGALWYWNFKNAGYIDQPAGNIIVSLLVDNVGSAYTAHLYGAVDNSLVSLAVNGNGVAPGTAMGYTTTYQSNPFTIVNGANVVTVVLNNSTPSAAGFNLRVRAAAGSVDKVGPSGWFF